jgi:hypothetical protein
MHTRGPAQRSFEAGLRDSHALEIFKNEGLSPNAAERVAEFFKRPKT